MEGSQQRAARTIFAFGNIFFDILLPFPKRRVFRGGAARFRSRQASERSAEVVGICCSTTANNGLFDLQADVSSRADSSRDNKQRRNRVRVRSFGRKSLLDHETDGEFQRKFNENSTLSCYYRVFLWRQLGDTWRQFLAVLYVESGSNCYDSRAWRTPRRRAVLSPPFLMYCNCSSGSICLQYIRHGLASG